MSNISAQEADNTHCYKKIKEKPYKTNTSNWFNKLCRTCHIIPATCVFIYALLTFSNSLRMLKIYRNMELQQIVCKNKYNFNIIAFAGFTV